MGNVRASVPAMKVLRWQQRRRAIHPHVSTAMNNVPELTLLMLSSNKTAGPVLKRLNSEQLPQTPLMIVSVM